MHRRQPSRTRPLLAGVGLLCLLALGAIAGWPGSADSAPLRVVVLGAGVDNVKPDCPASNAKQCQVVGRVTGFQSLSGEFVKPFQAPFEGKIVSWTVSLGHPRARARGNFGNEVSFFNQFFGEPSQARIGVLRKVQGTKPPKYRLVRQSPIQVLNPYFGEKIEFALDHPLGAARGDMIGLTIPTWAPAFFHARACEIGPDGQEIDPGQCAAMVGDNAWRASRRDGRCQFNAEDPDRLEAQIEKSRPHQKIGAEREYGCYYRSARLLYSATLVKKPRRAN